MIGSTTPPLQDRIFQAGNSRWSQMGRWQERVVIDPAVLRGKPVVRGTRIAVGFVIERERVRLRVLGSGPVD
jgi:hypothetical protein